MHDAQIEGPRRPARSRMATSVGVACFAYLGIATALWAALHFLGDRGFLGTLLVYGPRWPSILPLGLLVPGALFVRLRLLAPLALAALIVVGPVLGYQFRSPLGSEGARGELRVVSFNAANAPQTRRSIERIVARTGADVLAMQECRLDRETAASLEGLHAHVEDGLCLISRHPIASVEARDRREFWERHGSGAVIRYGIDVGSRRVWVANVHLATPRDGIEAALRAAFWRAAPEVEANARLRADESRAARAWVDATPGPVIVAGDFNLTVDSAIYRQAWGSLTNGFSAAGEGFGSTKRTRWFGARIDHVLTSREWQPTRAVVGSDLGSDHRPVIVDLRWLGAL